MSLAAVISAVGLHCRVASSTMSALRQSLQKAMQIASSDEDLNRDSDVEAEAPSKFHAAAWMSENPDSYAEALSACDFMKPKISGNSLEVS